MNQNQNQNQNRSSQNEAAAQVEKLRAAYWSLRWSPAKEPPMYVSPNYRTKKELKAAVEKWNHWMDGIINARSELRHEPIMAEILAQVAADGHPEITRRPQPVELYSPGPFPAPQNGPATAEGPHYPEPHRWYASVEVRDGLVVKVR